MNRLATHKLTQRQVHAVLLLVLGFFLPTQLGRHFFASFSIIGGVRIDYLAPTFYAIDFVLLAIILTHQSAITPVLRSRWFHSLLLVLGVNILFSHIPMLTAYWALRTIEGVWIAACIVHSRQWLNYFFWGSLAQAVLQLGLAVYQFVARHSAGGWWWFVGERPLSTTLPDIAKVTIGGIEYLRPYGTFSHPNSLGGYYALLVVFALLQVRARPLQKVLVGLSSVLVFLSLSKGAIAALAIGLGAVAYLRFEQQHKKAIGISALLFLGLGLGVFSQFVLSDPLALQKRIALLQQAAIIFWEHPLVGVGRGAYVSVQSAHDFGYAYFFAQPVHSVAALFLAEMGLMGVMWLGWLLWQNKDRASLLLVPLVCVLGVTGLIDHYWLTLIQNWSLLWIVIGGSIAHAHRRTKHTVLPGHIRQ